MQIITYIFKKYKQKKNRTMLTMYIVSLEAESSLTGLKGQSVQASKFGNNLFNQIPADIILQGQPYSSKLSLFSPSNVPTHLLYTSPHGFATPHYRTIQFLVIDHFLIIIDHQLLACHSSLLYVCAAHFFLSRLLQYLLLHSCCAYKNAIISINDIDITV